MKKYLNGQLVDMTKEEISELSNSNYYDGISYEELVGMFIREKYSIDEEFAIQRQRDTKQDEFAEYNAYCEECKTRARAIISVTE